MPRWKMPRTVNDGINSFEVIEVERIDRTCQGDATHSTQDDDTIGLTDFNKMQIQIKKDLTPQCKRLTFYHELAHIIFSDMGLQSVEDDVVEAMSRSLIRLMDKNPGLFSSLRKDDA